MSPCNKFTDSEIRAFLAHEIAHVLLNHPLQLGCLAFEWGQGGLGIKEAMPNLFDLLPGSRLDALAHFSFTIEYAADEYAMTLLREAKHDPHDMIRALERISLYPIHGKTIKDHPEMQDRIERLKKTAALPNSPP